MPRYCVGFFGIHVNRTLRDQEAFYAGMSCKERQREVDGTAATSEHNLEFADFMIERSFISQRGQFF